MTSPKGTDDERERALAECFGNPESEPITRKQAFRCGYDAGRASRNAEIERAELRDEEREAAMSDDYEYATTCCMAEPDHGYIEPPFSPKGDGWVLVTTAAMPASVDGRVHLLHSWRRGNGGTDGQ